MYRKKISQELHSFFFSLASKTSLVNPIHITISIDWVNASTTTTTTTTTPRRRHIHSSAPTETFRLASPGCLGETRRRSNPGPAGLGRLPPRVLHVPAHEGLTTAAAPYEADAAAAALAPERGAEPGRAWLCISEREAEGCHGHAEVMTAGRVRGGIMLASWATEDQERLCAWNCRLCHGFFAGGNICGKAVEAQVTIKYGYTIESNLIFENT